MKGRSYFSFFPKLLTVSRSAERYTNDEYSEVLNIFRRGKIRDDIGAVSTAFEKYLIRGNERPEQVAQTLYQDPFLDWIILLANNIINVQEEWPMDNETFRKYMLEKYQTEENWYKIHHYETEEFRDGWGRLVVPAGLIVDSDFNISALDSFSANQETRFSSNLPVSRTGSVTVSDVGLVKNSSGQELVGNNLKAITVYEYEQITNESKRVINVLKPEYVEIIIDDLRELMSYGQSSQYIDSVTKEGYNPRLTGI